MRRITTRTRHRKRAVDMLFEAQQRGFGDRPDRIRELLEKRQVLYAAQTPPPEYAIQIVSGVADNLAEIDTLIATYSRDWDIDRLAGTDLAAMRVAVWEMLANEEIDPRVAIDQAVTLVAVIGTDDSPSFVNAVLDRIRQEISADRKRFARAVSETGKVEASVETNWDDYLAAAKEVAPDPVAPAEPLPEKESEPEAEETEIEVEPVDPATIDKSEVLQRHRIPDWLLEDLVDDYADDDLGE